MFSLLFLNRLFEGERLPPFPLPKPTTMKHTIKLKIYSTAEAINALQRLDNCTPLRLHTELVQTDDLPRTVGFDVQLLTNENEARTAITKALGPLVARRGFELSKGRGAVEVCA